MRFLYVILGFFLGVMISRNAESMLYPHPGAIAFACVMLALLTYFGGNRDKASAVANAVSVAVAQAEVNFNAQLESKAAAMAQNAVSLYFDGKQVAVPSVQPTVSSSMAQAEIAGLITTSNDVDTDELDYDSVDDEELEVK